MPDIGQRGIEVNQILADAPHVAQALRIGEHALYHYLAQLQVVALELVTVELITRMRLGIHVLHGVLAVHRHHAVEREARRLLPDLQLGVTLHQLLTECRHAEHTASYQRRDGEYITALLKHLGELLIHPSGDALMLLPAQLSQFTPARHQFVFHSLKTLVESLALSR